MLTPDDFGLMGMAVVVSGFLLALADLGVGTALIQRKNFITKQQAKQLLLLMLGASCVIVILVWLFFSDLIAQFYRDERVRLIVIVLSMQTILLAGKAIPYAILARKMLFKKIARIEIIGTLVGSAIAITIAIMGFGVWALVAQSSVTILTTMPLYILESKKVDDVYSCNGPNLKTIIRNGLLDSATKSVVYVSSNLDYLILGRLATAASLGLYALPYMLTNSVRQQISNTLSRVMLASYSKDQNNKEIIKKNYLKIIKYNFLLICPIMLFFMVYADALLVDWVGDEWQGSVVILQILALAMLIHAVGGTSDSALKSIGKFRLLFSYQLIKSIVISLPIMLILISQYGALGAAISILVIKLISRFVNQYFMRRFFYIKEIDILRNLSLAFFPSLLFIIMSKITLPLIAINIISSFIAYFLIAFLLEKRKLLRLYDSLKQSKKLR